MVRGRLPRESNPVPGQSQPGFVPAFDETGNEDYVRVSNQKPYPVANYTQNASGVWLPTSQNNPMPTQLTGSITEHVVARNFLVTSGSSTRTPMVNHNAKKVVCVFRRRVDGFIRDGSYGVSLLERTEDGTYEIGEATDRIFEDATTGKHVMEMIEARSPTIQGNLVNKSTDDAYFDIDLYAIN